MLNTPKIIALYLMFFLFIANAESQSSIVTDVQRKTSQTNVNSLLFDYLDFGPPSMSFNLLGQSWWSWESSGGSDPNQAYPVMVVVYSNISLEQIKLIYPINPKKKKDYRYISIEQAIQYLNKNIQENAIPSVTAKLRETKGRLRVELMGRVE